MAEKLKQDILQPIPRIIGTNETASSESTARNTLATNKQTAQQFGDKKLSPNSSLKTAIIFGQEYARLTALGDPNAQLNALVAAVPPVFLEQIYFKAEEYDMGELVATHIWEAKYPFTEMPADFLDNPPDPAPPIWEQVPCAEGYYDEPFTTTDPDIYFTHYVDVDGYTYQDLGNVTLDIVGRTESTVTEDTIDVWAGRTEYKPDDFDWIYQSQGSGTYSYSRSTALTVNGVTKLTINEFNSYSETWDFIWDEFDEVVVRASVTRSGFTDDGFPSGSAYDERGIGGGDLLTAHFSASASFGPYIYEYDCAFDGGSWSVSTSNAVRKSGHCVLSINSTAISSRAFTDDDQVKGLRSTDGSSCVYSHNALVGADSRGDMRSVRGVVYGNLGCAFGGGSSEFYGLFTLDCEDDDYTAGDDNLLFYHPAFRPNYYKMIPLTGTDANTGNKTGNEAYTQDVYLAWCSASRGRSLQVKKLFTVATGWGDNYDIVHFNTNDWIIMVLNPVANWDTDAYELKYYIIERNPPFRIITKPVTTSYYLGPWITAWRRITPA